MTTLTITDLPQTYLTKTSYSSEELLKILLNNLDYSIEFDFFSKSENKELSKQSNWNHTKISNLID